MAYIRDLWFMYRLRRKVRAAGYDVEILFANWVELPRGYWEIIGRR